MHFDENAAAVGGLVTNGSLLMGTFRFVMARPTFPMLISCCLAVAIAVVAVGLPVASVAMAFDVPMVVALPIGLTAALCSRTWFA